MDVAQGLLEIEVLIHFRRGDADVAAGREAPVRGLDLGAGDDPAQAGYGHEPRFGKAGEQPVGLALKIGGALELFDQSGDANDCSILLPLVAADAGSIEVFDQAA